MKLMMTALAISVIALTTAPGSAVAGDAARGKVLYESRCVACHSIDGNLVGPAHRGVYGRRAGSVQGYDYSTSLCNSHIKWTEKTLDRWLANPEGLIPGQKMGYSVPDPKDRADLIAFLKFISQP